MGPTKTKCYMCHIQLEQKRRAVREQEVQLWNADYVQNTYKLVAKTKEQTHWHHFADSTADCIPTQLITFHITDFLLPREVTLEA